MDLISIVLSITTLVLAFFVWRFFEKARTLGSRYSPIIDLEAELAGRRSSFEADVTARTEQLEQTKRKQEAELTATRNKTLAEVAAAESKLEELKRDETQFEAANEQRKTQLNSDYEQALKKYKELKQEVSLLEENIEDISFGLYKPHFTFQTTEDYRAALEKVRDEQRQMIRNGRAAACATTWTVQGSAREGDRMAKQYTKLLLRGFNGECDAAVANVTWNNVTKMEERIRKAWAALNQLGSVMQMSLSVNYLNLKLDELRLTHEYEEKRYHEKEEQRRIREEIREEERAQRELEKAREEAEREEQRFQKALETAREEAMRSTGAQLEKLTKQIAGFEAKLDEARQNKQRAISRAQQTKSGFVYVISNVGSFGERVIKIGMTRRMEPMERVAELGDASVPFPFDLHAMLYSDNAPELEGALHQLLEDRRVNLVNSRKEFYRNVDIGEVEQFVRSRGLSAQFMKLPEAKEYRESVAILEQRASKAIAPDKFSDTLFHSTVGAS